jgi:CheY-like chemotaxis protein
MDAEHPGFVTVDVTDSGVGIEPQYLPRVTERFFRVGEHVSGAGLGLHICKELLERHGGAIEIKSPPPGRNKGTQASFRIPVIVPPLLLIVCADEHIRLSLMKALDASGYRVAISRGGDTEVESPGDMAPDLILVDWIQEGMEGGIAIAKLKAKDGWRDIPIIAMTGGTADGPKREILEGLGIPVLHCPWQPQELLNCLDGAMMEK